MDEAYRDAQRDAQSGSISDLLNFARQQTLVREDNTETIETALKAGAKWENVLPNFPDYQKKHIDH